MPLTRPRRAVFALALAAPALPVGGYAAAGEITGHSRVIATHADWSVVVADTDRGKVCYAAGSPQLRRPEGAVRAQAYMFVTTRPDDRVRDELSVEFGFEAASGATLSVGGETFALAGDERGAWVEAIADEPRMVALMRRSAQMTVRSVSQLGEETRDIYSLKGFGTALDHARRECADPDATGAVPGGSGKPA